MGTYLFSLLSWSLPVALEPLRPESHLLFIGLVFIVTFLLPVTIMGIFRTFGTISSFAMENRRERFLPFTFIAFVYIFVTYLLYNNARIGLNDNFLKLM